MQPHSRAFFCLYMSLHRPKGTCCRSQPPCTSSSQSGSLTLHTRTKWLSLISRLLGCFAAAKQCTHISMFFKGHCYILCRCLLQASQPWYLKFTGPLSLYLPLANTPAGSKRTAGGNAAEHQHNHQQQQLKANQRVWRCSSSSSSSSWEGLWLALSAMRAHASQWVW